MIKDLLRKLFDEPTLASRPDHQLAALALLVEVAMADGDLDSKELASLRAAIAQSHGLAGDALEQLLYRARHAQEQTTSVYAFTRVINDEFDETAKFALVQDMWAVAYADGRLDKYEEHRIRRLAELIHLPHSEFIRAKLAARDGLSCR